MTPEEWHTSDSTLEMLEALPTDRFTRELLVYTVAICHLMISRLPSESLEALSVVDEYLAGSVSQEEVREATCIATIGRDRARAGLSYKSVRICLAERAAMIVQTATTLDVWRSANEAALACCDLLDDNAADLLRQAIVVNPLVKDSMSKES
jgi:hypothetical protein